MMRSALVGLAGFLLGGLVVGLMTAYPKWVSVKERYCRLCASHEKTRKEGAWVGGVSSHEAGTGGPFARLLSEASGTHEHQYSDWATVWPSSDVTPEHPEVERKLTMIHQMQDDPHLIAALEQAFRNDRARTLGLVRQAIDPTTRGLPVTVFHPLSSDEPWEQRWTKVNAAIAQAERAPLGSPRAHGAWMSALVVRWSVPDAHVSGI